jgi:hypothetical protein
LRPECVKALSRRGLARVQLGEYTQGESDVNKALELLPEDEVAERERIKIILMKAKKGLNEQKKSLEKRKKSMQKGFAAKDGGIGDSRVKPDPKPKRPKPQQSKSQVSLFILGSLVVLLISIAYVYVM